MAKINDLVPVRLGFSIRLRFCRKSGFVYVMFSFGPWSINAEKHFFSRCKHKTTTWATSCRYEDRNQILNQDLNQNLGENIYRELFYIGTIGNCESCDINGFRINSMSITCVLLDVCAVGCV